MNNWKSIGSGIDAIISPKSSDPIVLGQTSVLIELSIYYRFDGTIPAGTLVNFSFDGAFIGSGTITAPSVPVGKKVVLYAEDMGRTVTVNPATGLSYNVRLNTTVPGVLTNTFAQTFEVDAASEYPYPPLKNISIARTGSMYRINWENQIVERPNNVKSEYYRIDIEEQALSANSPEGPYIQHSSLPGNGATFALTFPSDVTLRKFRITPRGQYLRNRSKSSLVSVRVIPSTPDDIAVNIIRNGIRLLWSVVEPGVRYYTIQVKSPAGVQSFNISTANRFYDFTSLDLGTEYSFAISHRDDLTGLFSEVSKWSTGLEPLGIIANGKRGTDFRFGNYQPSQIYLGDKLIWIR